jgi:hypothetical protein
MVRLRQLMPSALHQIITLLKVPSHGVGASRAFETLPTRLDAVPTLPWPL